MAWQLAAPHTWPAAIMPALIAAASAGVIAGKLSVTMTIALLLISILMQSSVNTFNDYFDYVKGADSMDDNVEPSDAVLVYRNINPKSALGLAIGFLAVAFAIGVYPIIVAGFFPLIVAAVAAIIVVLYSGGKTPISYLPIGEAVSGVVMGGLIPLACNYVLLKAFDPLIIVWALPTVIAVGLIMFTNNTCDIDKDIVAGRRTLSVLLGRKRSRILYLVLLLVMVALIIVILALWFTPGVIIIPFMLFAAYAPLRNLALNPLNAQARIGAMGLICNLNIILGAFYACGICAAGAFVLTP